MTFRGVWVVDVEHRIVLFSRRFPNVERRYVSYLSPQTDGANAADAPSPGPQPAAWVPTSIQGISDALLMDALLSHICRETEGDASASGTTLARMKLGPFLSPIPIVGETTKGGQHQGGDAGHARSTASTCVVGPWIVSEGRRGVVHVVAQPGTKPTKPTGSKRGTSAHGTHSGSSPTLSTSSLASVPQLPQLVVYDHPDDVVIAESHPTHTYKQNLLVVALPLCSVPSAHSSTWGASPAEDPSFYLSDVRMLMAWEAVRCSLQPFVDHLLLVAPTLPNRPASQADAAPLMLQPHGMIVTPHAKRDARLPQMQDAPPSWVDPKVGTHALHVVGGWSTKTTLRRVISTFHWAQAFHALLATALPFGSITALLPQHTGTLTLGTAMQVRAEHRVDASLKNIMSPSMEPEALFQSAESGDRKMRCSEMLVVDALHLNERTTPPASNEERGGGQFGSTRSDDYGTAQKQRVVPSRAMRLLKEYEHKAAKGNAASSSASNTSPRRIWDPVLTNGACIGISLVCEVAAQSFGQPNPTATAAPAGGPASSSAHRVPHGDAYHCMYRVQATPPQSPNLHWLQRVEELTEAVEDAGIAAVVAEDVFPIAVVVPQTWRLSHAGAPGSPHESTTSTPEGTQLHVAFDETLIASTETLCDVVPQPLAALKPLPGTRGGAASKHKDKSAAAAVSAATQALLDDPAAVVNQGLDAVCKYWSGQSLTTGTPLTGKKPTGSASCDVVLFNAQGLHLWGYQRTSAIPRPEECLHLPTDLAHLTPPTSVMRSSQPVVKGVYALTPVANPYDVHKLLSSSFGCDETSVADVLTAEERAEAQRLAKENPTDNDFESRLWIEGLLESPGNVLYHLDLDLVLPVCTGRGGADSRDASSKSSASGESPSQLGFVEVLAFSVVLRFLEEVSVVSLHTLQSTAYDEHGVRLYSAGADGADTVEEADGGGGSGGFEHATDGRPPLQQLAADTVLWHTPIQGRVVRCGSRIRLDALVVLDLRSRSGAHELHSVLTTKHHMHPTEWRQLTTVISSAQLDFVFRTHDPALTGGVQLMDPGVCASAFPGITRSLELKASSMRSDLSSLHEAVHVGGPEDALNVVREAPSARSVTLKRPPVAAPMIVRSSPASGYVLWNFAPGAGE